MKPLPAILPVGLALGLAGCGGGGGAPAMLVPPEVAALLDGVEGAGPPTSVAASGSVTYAGTGRADPRDTGDSPLIFRAGIDVDFAEGDVAGVLDNFQIVRWEDGTAIPESATEGLLNIVGVIDRDAPMYFLTDVGGRLEGIYGPDTTVSGQVPAAFVHWGDGSGPANGLYMNGVIYVFDGMDHVYDLTVSVQR